MCFFQFNTDESKRKGGEKQKNTAQESCAVLSKKRG